MKKIILFTALTISAITLFAADYLFIHHKDNNVTSVDRSTVDSIKFTSDQTELTVYNNTPSTSIYALSNIDSITFSSISDETIKIIYNETNVSITNPFANKGVSITASGADVTVNSTLLDKELTYNVSGTSSDGSLKIYSNYKYILALNGATITNANGSAINIQSTKKCTLDLISGTTNTLTDAITYATSTEDQKSTLFSEGQLIIKGTGTLNVSSKSKHAISSDDYIEIEGGIINVTSAAKDGIHTNDHFNLEGGTVTVTATGDAVDCEAGNIKISGGSISSTLANADTKGLKSDSTLLVSGGTINFTVSGNQAKGLKAGQNMTLSGGNINITTSGAAVLVASGSGFDPSYCTAIKCDSSILISGATINITTSGVGNKAISADKNLDITSGIVKITGTGAGATYTNSLGVIDAYSSSGIDADGNINILGGNLTTNSSGTGGKGLKANGTLTIGSATQSPTVSLTTTGTTFLVSGSDLCHPKTMVTDGAITIVNGTNTISSTDDAIHSETSITISGGNNTITKATEGIESKYIYINGGENNITSSNDGLNGTMGTTSGGTESNDNSLISISGGATYVTGADAIDANGNLIMTGGIVFSNGPSSGMEEFIDANGTAKINGGVFVGCSSAGMLKTSTFSSSTQPFLYMTTTLSTSTMYTVTAGGNWVASFKPKNGGKICLVSAPQMTKGAAYVVYTGGTYTGGTAINNFYMNGTYSNTGATTKKSSTLSTTATLNSISF